VYQTRKAKVSGSIPESGSHNRRSNLFTKRDKSNRCFSSNFLLTLWINGIIRLSKKEKMRTETKCPKCGGFDGYEQIKNVVRGAGWFVRGQDMRVLFCRICDVEIIEYEVIIPD